MWGAVPSVGQRCARRLSRHYRGSCPAERRRWAGGPGGWAVLGVRSSLRIVFFCSASCGCPVAVAFFFSLLFLLSGCACRLARVGPGLTPPGQELADHPSVPFFWGGRGGLPVDLHRPPSPVWRGAAATTPLRREAAAWRRPAVATAGAAAAGRRGQRGASGSTAPHWVLPSCTARCRVVLSRGGRRPGGAGWAGGGAIARHRTSPSPRLSAPRRPRSPRHHCWAKPAERRLGDSVPCRNPPTLGSRPALAPPPPRRPRGPSYLRESPHPAWWAPSPQRPPGRSSPAVWHTRRGPGARYGGRWPLRCGGRVPAPRPPCRRRTPHALWGSSRRCWPAHTLLAKKKNTVAACGAGQPSTRRLRPPPRGVPPPPPPGRAGGRVGGRGNRRGSPPPKLGGGPMEPWPSGASACMWEPRLDLPGIGTERGGRPRRTGRVGRPVQVAKLGAAAAQRVPHGRSTRWCRQTKKKNGAAGPCGLR